MTDDHGNKEAVWRIVDVEVVNNATTDGAFDHVESWMRRLRSSGSLSSDISDAELRGDQAGRCQSGLEPGPNATTLWAERHGEVPI